MNEEQFSNAILKTYRELADIQAPPGLEGVNAMIWTSFMLRLSAIDTIMRCYWDDEVSAKRAVLAIAGELGEMEWGTEETWEAYDRWCEREETKPKSNHLKSVATPVGEENK